MKVVSNLLLASVVDQIGAAAPGSSPWFGGVPQQPSNNPLFVSSSPPYPEPESSFQSSNNGFLMDLASKGSSFTQNKRSNQSTSSFSTSSHLKRVDLTKTNSQAVCNDGSPAYYYVETNPKSSKWLIYLEAGGQCYDEDSCAERWLTTPDLMTSLHYPESISLSGVFDRDQSPLGDANKAYLKYCTSDGHMGNATETDTSPFQFRGKVVVEALLTSLFKEYGMCRASADPAAVDQLIVFGGFSAGARGAMVHLDTVSEELELHSEGTCRVVGLLDSPLYLDVDPLHNRTLPFRSQMSDAFSNFNETREAECSSLDDDWKCIFGQYRLPLVQTPFLLFSDLYDAYQLGVDTGKVPTNQNLTQEEKEYDSAFAQKMKQYVQATTPSREAATKSMVFSPSCGTHAVSTSPLFWQMTVNGISERDMLKDFLAQFEPGAQSSAAQHRVVDQCSGSIACGKGCPSSSLQSLFLSLKTKAGVEESPRGLLLI